jgi:hypothetical protein
MILPHPFAVLTDVLHLQSSQKRARIISRGKAKGITSNRPIKGFPSAHLSIYNKPYGLASFPPGIPVGPIAIPFTNPFSTPVTLIRKRRSSSPSPSCRTLPDWRRD